MLLEIKRIKTLMGIISEAYPYDDLQKNPTPQVVTDIIKNSKGLLNDKEAWAEAAFNKINNSNFYNQVTKLLGQDPYEFLKQFMDVNKKYHIKSITDHYNLLKVNNTTSRPKTTTPTTKTQNLGGRMDGTQMTVSQNFWDWIKKHEGDPKKKGEPMYKTYTDTAGVSTIGYGHTGEYAKPGNVIDIDTANKILYKDAKVSADCLRRLLNRWKSQGSKGYLLKQNEFDALASMIFNAGCNGFLKSDVVKNLKLGGKNIQLAANEIKNFRAKGLTNRRNSEFTLFAKNQYMA
jgi:lysozyme